MTYKGFIGRTSTDVLRPSSHPLNPKPYQLLAKSVEDHKNSLASSSDLGCLQPVQKFQISRPCPADPEEALPTYIAEAIRDSANQAAGSP